MRFATSGILQFFVMSSYCVLRAQCYCTQCSSYIETYQNTNLSPSFDNFFMENRNFWSNVTFYVDLMPKGALLSLLGASLIAPSFNLHEVFWH